MTKLDKIKSVRQWEQFAKECAKGETKRREVMARHAARFNNQKGKR